MSCPFFTCALKSAYQARMRPETWLPTWTVTMAETVPLAVTFAVEGAVVRGGALVSNHRGRPRMGVPPSQTRGRDEEEKT